MIKRKDAPAARRIRSAAGAAVAEPEAPAGDEPKVQWTPGEVAEITRHVRAAIAATDSTPEQPEDVYYDVVISTETPTMIAPGVSEILGHGEGEIDMSLAKDGIAFLLEHGGPQAPYKVDPAYHIGLVTNIRLENRKLRGELRFGTNANAQMVQADYDRISPATPQGIRPKTSVGWLPHGPKFKTERSQKGNLAVLRRTGWVLAEDSSVSVPGDPNSRRGRSGPGLDAPVITEGVPPTKEGRTMKRVRNAAGTALIEVDDADPRQAVTDADIASELQTRSTVIQAAERMRIVRISDLCAKLGKQERAAKFIADGVSFDDAFDDLMKATQTRDASGRVMSQPASEAIVQGVSKKDLQRAGGYNILRAIRCAVNDNFDDSFEGDLHKAIAAQMPADMRPSQRHVLVPLRAADLSEGEFIERNTIAERFMRAAGPLGTGLPGTAPIIGQQFLEPVDLLRNTAQLAALGARVYPNLTGMVQIAVRTDTATVYRKEENPAAAATQSAPQWDFKQVTPKAYIGDVPIPIQVIATASIDAQAEAQRDLLMESFLAMDLDGIYGSGTNNAPLGIYPDTEVQELSMGAAVPSWKKFQKMIGMVANYNIPGQGISALTTPPVATELAATLKDAAVAGYIWEGAYDGGLIGGYRATSTNQMRQTHTTDSRVSTGGTQHGFIAGSFGWFNFLLWGALVIKIDDVTLFTKGQIRVMSQLLGATLNRRSKAFVVAKGVAVSA
jgi:HK97 family phage major capsid protein